MSNSTGVSSSVAQTKSKKFRWYYSDYNKSKPNTSSTQQNDKQLRQILPKPSFSQPFVQSLQQSNQQQHSLSQTLFEQPLTTHSEPAAHVAPLPSNSYTTVSAAALAVTSGVVDMSSALRLCPRQSITDEYLYRLFENTTLPYDELLRLAESTEHPIFVVDIEGTVLFWGIKSHRYHASMLRGVSLKHWLQMSNFSTAEACFSLCVSQRPQHIKTMHPAFVVCIPRDSNVPPSPDEVPSTMPGYSQLLLAELPQRLLDSLPSGSIVIDKRFLGTATRIDKIVDSTAHQPQQPHQQQQWQQDSQSNASESSSGLFFSAADAAAHLAVGYLWVLQTTSVTETVIDRNSNSSTTTPQ